MNTQKYDIKNALIRNASIYIVFAVLICAVFITGCSSSGNLENNIPTDTSNGNAVQGQIPDASGNSAGADGNYPGNYQGNNTRGQFNGSRSGRYDGGMNLTDEQRTQADEQRTQMMQQRLQVEIDACSGMSEGDSCTMNMNNPSGQENSITGTCETRNGSIACKIQMNGGERMPPVSTE